MDKPANRRRSKIDLVLDLNSETARYRGNNPFRIRGLEAALLACLIKNDPDPTFLKELHETVGLVNWHKVRERLTAKLKQQGLTLDYIRGQSVCLFEQPQEPSRSIDSTFDNDSILNRRPLVTDSPALASKHGFAISIDGIILNTASELIYQRVDSSQVRDCRLLYRSSIEDLAFALVYGAKLSSKWRPQLEVMRDLGVAVSEVPHEPAEILISQFDNDLYEVDIEHKRFRYGRVLDDEQARLQIGQYITSLANAMVMPSVRKICREWLVREAVTYFGEHRSLFASSKTDERLRFGKVYYGGPFLQKIPALLGQDTLNTLIGFLPPSPRGKRSTDLYSPFALQQFVSQNVLTLMTVMYEYERIAEPANTHRLPFILRSLVKEKWHEDYEAEGQLRTLLVRSALYEGIRESEDAYGREQLVKRLLWVRKEPEFVQMRSLLNELSVMVKEKRSQGIKNLLAEIRGSQQLRNDTVVRIGISRNTVMSRVMLKRVDARAYIERLERFFPELGPRH